jgi:hypothetical protein
LKKGSILISTIFANVFFNPDHCRIICKNSLVKLEEICVRKLSGSCPHVKIIMVFMGVAEIEAEWCLSGLKNYNMFINNY